MRRGAIDRTALICGAVLLAAALLARTTIALPVACYSVRWFGIPCPGCGLSRAFMALTRGEFGNAWELHPWVFGLFPLTVLGLLRPLWHRAATERWRALAPEKRERWQRWKSTATWLVLATFALWAAWRSTAY